MKVFLKILKYFGLIILGIVILISLAMLKAVNYKEYDVKADINKFPGIETKKDMDVLAEKFVSDMTLDEKLEQMYGEKPFWGWQKFIGNFIIMKKFPHHCKVTLSLSYPKPMKLVFLL